MGPSDFKRLPLLDISQITKTILRQTGDRRKIRPARMAHHSKKPTSASGPAGQASGRAHTEEMAPAKELRELPAPRVVKFPDPGPEGEHGVQAEIEEIKDQVRHAMKALEETTGNSVQCAEADRR